MTETLQRPYARDLMRRIAGHESVRRKEARYLEEGRCVDCGQLSDAGRRCLECRASASRSTLRWRERRAADGLCIQCGSPKPNRGKRCGRCQRLNRLKRRRRVR